MTRCVTSQYMSLAGPSVSFSSQPYGKDAILVNPERHHRKPLTLLRDPRAIGHLKLITFDIRHPTSFAPIAAEHGLSDSQGILSTPHRESGR